MNHCEHIDGLKAKRISPEEVMEQMTDTASLLGMSDLFKCFSDPTRLKIINVLLLAEMCVCDLTKVMNMTQPSVSHHLKHLRQMRLVKYRRDGKSIYYSLNDYHIQLLFDLCKTHLNESKS